MIQCSPNGARTVLCLGAHSDDIEIGCGATLLKMAAECEELTVWWVVFTAAGKRRAEAKASARMFLGKGVKAKIIIKQFRNGFFPLERDRIKEVFEQVK